MKFIIIFLLTIYCSISLAEVDVSNVNRMPPEIVPNGKMAISIARPILENIFGYSTIQDEEPLIATRVDAERWLVEGTFNHPGADGGVARILIRRRDGAVLGLVHER